MIIASPRGKRSRGKGRAFRREDRARLRREGRSAFPFLLPRAPFVLFTRPKSSFSSLCNACNESRLSLKEWIKMEWFQSYNINILVKPSYYFNNIFVIFLSSQCSLLKCVIKAFNKRQCLTVYKNLVHYLS